MSLDDAQLGSSPRLAPDVIDPLLALEVRHRGGTVIVRVTGDLDVRTVFELRDLLAHIMSESSPRELVLDLLELNSVDSIGLELFQLTHERGRGMRTPLCAGESNSFRLRAPRGLGPHRRPRHRWADAPDLEGHAPARDRSRADAVWDPVPGVAT